jgi:hypothetical protein
MNEEIIKEVAADVAGIQSPPKDNRTIKIRPVEARGFLAEIAECQFHAQEAQKSAKLAQEADARAKAFGDEIATNRGMEIAPRYRLNDEGTEIILIDQ